MKFSKRGGCSVVTLDPDEVASAVRAYLVAHNVSVTGPSTVRIETPDDTFDDRGQVAVIVDPSGRLIAPGGDAVTADPDLQSGTRVRIVGIEHRDGETGTVRGRNGMPYYQVRMDADDVLRPYPRECLVPLQPAATAKVARDGIRPPAGTHEYECASHIPGGECTCPASWCSDSRGHQFCDAAGNRVYLHCQRGCGTRDPEEPVGGEVAR